MKTVLIIVGIIVVLAILICVGIEVLMRKLEKFDDNNED